MFFNLLNQKRTLLLTQIEQIQTKLQQLPPGKLLCVQNGRYIKWYKSNGSAPIYIPKKQAGLAESLALRKYYTFKLEELTSELSLLDQHLEGLQHISQNSELLLNHPSYLELLKPNLTSYSQTVQNWITDSYQRNTKNPEHLIHKTISGHLVRSKSEVMIANCLSLNNIPYRYECALTLGDTLVFPDFTIMHPASHQIFYWEHFGRMDEPFYCEQTYNKLKLYGHHHIIPTIQLIATYETRLSPIDSENVLQLIREFFL